MVEKWFNPFWRKNLIRTYGDKKTKENWVQYANRVNAKLPKKLDKDRLAKIK